MSTTPIAPLARIRDVNLDTVIATTTVLLDWSISWGLDGPGTLMVEVPLGDAVATAMIAAAGGPDGTGTTKPYMLELSLGGGSNADGLPTVDARKMIEQPITSTAFGQAGVREDGQDLYAGYSTNGVDRGTFRNTTLGPVLNGAPGTIPVDTTTVNGIVIYGPTLPNVKGLYQTVPGNAGWAGKNRLKFTPLVDSHLNGVPVSADLQTDTILHATQVLTNGAAGLYLASDPAPFGSRCHFVPDSSDAAVNIAGVDRGIAVGYAGAASVLTFDGNGTGPVTEATTARALNVQRTPQLDGLYAQAAFRGGTSTHGMPDGGSITTIVVVNTTTGGAAWDASLPIVAVSTGGNGGGGVFYFPHDGALHRMSPAMDVADLCANGNTLYMATPTGCYTYIGPFGVTKPVWSKVGGLSTNVTKVWYADNGLHALVSGSGSQADAVYRYAPGAGGDVANSGYAGWVKEVQAGGSIIGAAGGSGGVLYADSNDPAAVTIGNTRIPIPIGSAVTGVDAFSGYIFIRTSAGADGLYFYTGGQLVNANPDSSLVDVVGNPVMINRVLPYAGSLWKGPVGLIACTDQGLYVSPLTNGGSWYSLTSQNGLGNSSVYCVAAGQPQTLLGRTVTRVYAANASQFFVSNTAGLYAYDLLAEPVDMGPAWQAAARQAGLVPFADNSVGGLASNVAGMVAAANVSMAQPVTSYVNVGGTGAVVQIPAGQLSSMPAGFVWARRLDEHNDWTYRVVDVNSASPYNSWMPSDLTELQTNALVGVITASQRVFVASLRWLSQANKAQTVLTIESYFTLQEAALRRLRPTMLVSLTHTLSVTGPAATTSVTAYSASPFYVLGHQIRKSPSGGAAETSTTVGKLLQTQRLSPQEVAADLNTKIKNLSQYAA